MDDVMAQITGTTGNDTLNGTNEDDTISGGAGFDLISAGGGNDIVDGGLDGDTINGGAGDDIINGGEGNDVISDGRGADRLFGDGGNDSFNISLSGGGRLIADGGTGNDSFIVVDGGGPNQSVTLIGGQGNDSIRLGGLAAGNIIDAGSGDDVVRLGSMVSAEISLGAGADLVVLESNFDGTGGVVISDWELGIDHLTPNLSQILVGWDGVSDPFAGGFLRLAQSGSDTILQIDTNGGSDGYTRTISFSNIAVSAFFQAEFPSYAPPPPFATESLVLTAFGYSAGGWTSDDMYPRVMADVNNDGRADIVGFGNDGVFVALANAGGSYNPSILASVNFGYATGAGGWTSNTTYARDLADVNGDSRADIVAFGEGGTYVALGNANGTFGAAVVATGQFGRSGAAGGWTSNDVYHRELGDVNGDNRADIIGFGNDGVYVALGQANGTFAAAQVASVNFGYSTGAGGWTSDDIYPRRVADVNGDNFDDIIAFGEGGTYVALGNANGTFGAAFVATGEFGRSTSAGGWTSNDSFYRELADVNGDGRADIVGFGLSGTYVALGQANGTFAASQVVSGNYGSGPEAGGWASQDIFPRHLADVNNDGLADIVGFGDRGVYVALSNHDYWI